MIRLSPPLLPTALAFTFTALCACNGRKATDGTDHDAAASIASQPAPVAASAPSAASAAAPVAPPSDPMALHQETREGLLALFQLDPSGGNGRKRDPGEFLRKNFGPGGSGLSNQGNKEIAHHATANETCLAGLEGIVLQTGEQRRLCKGHDYMVPLHPPG
ncbi:MAG TPA: hypothetical protein PLI95_12340, partial [Polyangiaceae bacterium]|nr:hypothetical protein [Polyangiaceae bacterium]